MIDIVIIIAAILSFYIGYRRGFIVQLISLIGLYLAILLAPAIAEPVGSIFFDNEVLAFVGGFFVVVAVAMLLIWFIAPIIGKLVVWNPLKRVNALLGGVLNLVMAIIIMSALFAIFDSANISNELNEEKIYEYVDNNLDSGNSSNIQDDIKALADGDIETMRIYFKPRFVEYDTLESSALFYPLANFGRSITPTIDSFNEQIRAEAKESIDKEIFLN